MLIAVVRFPPVPMESDEDFRAWFAWSNDLLRDADGLRARRLLRSDDGGYLALVEHDSAETFARMHASPVAAEVQQRLHQLLEDGPQAHMYEVVEDAMVGGCCGGHGATPAPGRSETRSSGGGGCCGGGSDVELAGGSPEAEGPWRGRNAAQ